MKRATRTIAVISLALVSCRGPTFAPTATPEVLDVRMLATTATFPLLEDFARSYAQPGTVLVVNSTQASWATVHRALAAGDAPFALTTYLPPEAGLWAAPIGQDAIAIITHPANPVTALTLAEVRALFLGHITTWAALDGPDLSVTVVSHETGTDTYLAFRAGALNGKDVTPGARLALSASRLVEIVTGTPGAVGFVSLAHLKATTPVRVLPVAVDTNSAPVVPALATVAAGEYPLCTPVLVVGPQPPAPASFYRDWFAWMQSPPGQRIVARYYAALQS